MRTEWRLALMSTCQADYTNSIRPAVIDLDEYACQFNAAQQVTKAQCPFARSWKPQTGQ